jgi:two-component system nitrate/nitrite response regulator NarL
LCATTDTGGGGGLGKRLACRLPGESPVPFPDLPCIVALRSTCQACREIDKTLSMKSQTLTTPTLGSANNITSRPHNGAAGGRLRSRPSRRIRVLVADDHPVVRRGIAFWLERQANLEVVGEATDGQEALRKAREFLPDVLLTDIDMPHMTGLAVTEALQKELPQIKVLMLSSNISADFMLRCAQSGANGYILKQASPEEFVQAIETVNAGQPFFSPEVARVALNQMVRGREQGPDTSDLSNREREVLTYIAEGLCNKEIACRLNIGTRTVETHRERLMRKLDIHSIAGLTKFAVAKGLIAMPELALACG